LNKKIFSWRSHSKLSLMAKKKLKRNISGLRNQSQNTAAPFQCQDPASDSHPEASEGGITASDDNTELRRHPDDIRPRWEGYSDDEEGEGEFDEGIGASSEEWVKDLSREGFQVKMMRMALDNGDDPHDEDWVPQGLRCFCDI
jgi:hypothetical protein